MTASHQKPAKHGRDHLPGGEDPIPTTAGVQPISAYGLAYNRSLTCTGNLPLLFDEVWTNDDSLGYTAVTGGRAGYLTISRDGWYLADFAVSWNSAWTVGDNPFIEPSDYIGGVAGTLQNDVESGGWNDDQGVIYGEQFVASEVSHLQLVSRIWFNFTEAYFGFSSIGIGVNIGSSASRTKNFGGMVQVTWMGDPLTQQTIV